MEYRQKKLKNLLTVNQKEAAAGKQSSKFRCRTVLFSCPGNRTP